MLNKIKEWSGVVAVVILVIGIFLPGAPTNRLGNATASYQDAAQGFRVNGTEVVSSAAVVDGNISSTITSATVNSLTYSGNCATATWNPGSISSSTTGTSVDIALTGAVLGDLCQASLTSATSTSAHVNCDINQTATATLKLFSSSATALDLATGTARVCIVH